MYRSWSEIFPGLAEPVQGTVASYQAAESECDDFKAVAESCADEFDRVSSSESLGELGGQAADQLITLITAVDGSFLDVPPVFATLAAIFDNHQQELSALRQEAVAALALANTRWNVLQHSEAASVSAKDALRRINIQIRSLERSAGVEPGLQIQLDDLYGNRAGYQADAASCTTAVGDAELELDWSRIAHASLVSAEHEMVEHTVSCLKGIDLDDLDDPSLLGQIASDVGGYITDLARDIVVGVAQLAEALASGDWSGVLWHLSDLLDSVLTVVTVIALVAAVVASGGLLAGLLIVGLAVMTAKLSIDLLLVGSQCPHPDTGRPMTWHEVAVESAVYAFAVGTGGASGVGGRVLGPGATSQAAMRTFAVNLRNVVVAASTRGGSRLQSAALDTSAVAGSGRRVVEVAIDEAIVPKTQGEVESLVNDVLSTNRLITDPSAWVNPALLDFMRDSPMTSDALERINAAARAVLRFSVSGPSFRPSAPMFQLTVAV
jgi:hypothetical protein